MSKLSEYIPAKLPPKWEHRGGHGGECGGKCGGGRGTEEKSRMVEELRGGGELLKDRMYEVVIECVSGGVGGEEDAVEETSIKTKVIYSLQKHMYSQGSNKRATFFLTYVANSHYP